MRFYPNIVNTCNICGAPCQGVWARNEDEARSGGGVCHMHTDVPILELGTEAEVLEMIEGGQHNLGDLIGYERFDKGRSRLLAKLEAEYEQQGYKY